MYRILSIIFIILTITSTQTRGNNSTNIENTINNDVRSMNSQDVDFDNPTKVLSRRKRFIVFPEGSSFSVSINCYIN